MRIGIIGAGFTGLSAGFYLSKLGHQVTIFESSDLPGGLAIGFKNKKWNWSLEHHYHHLFTSDNSIIQLAKEVDHSIIFSRPKTSSLIKTKIYQLDSPLNLLTFSPLSIVNRIRMGFVLAYLKVTSDWKGLEKTTAKKFITKYMGNQSWEILWKSLMVKKFNIFANEISAAWFWARIKKRSASLGYPERGFLKLAESIAKQIIIRGGAIIYQTKIIKISEIKDKIVLETDKNQSVSFDKVISTLPSYLFLSITPSLKKSFKKTKGLGAINLVLELNQKFFEDDTYWLNVNDLKYPFLAVVEHTNFVSKSNYGNKHLIYIGNYLDSKHRYFGLDAKELLTEYLPYLQKINKSFSKKMVNNLWVFKANFAQPIISKNYSRKIPKLETSIKNLYLANIEQVYPWDRGTNYAVELGKKVADLIIK